MDAQFFPGRTIVRSNVRFWGQGGEKSMEIVPRYQLFQNSDRFRYSRAIFVELNIMQEKVENIPITRIRPQTTNLILWDIVLISICGTPVGLETLDTGSQRHDFFPNRLCVLLQFQHPGKFLPIPESFQRHTRDQIRTA